VVDAEALNRFHGVHFGDEIETDTNAETASEALDAAEAGDKATTTAEVDEEVASEDDDSDDSSDAEDESTTTAEADEEVASEDGDSDDSSDAEDSESTSTMNFRDDVLVRVMEAHGIDVAEKDAFVAHAANFDHDDNGYLKKQELEAAAKAWNADDGASEVEEAETAEVTEEATEEATEAEEKACGICGTMNPADATECSACKFDLTV